MNSMIPTTTTTTLEPHQQQQQQQPSSVVQIVDHNYIGLDEEDTNPSTTHTMSSTITTTNTGPSVLSYPTTLNNNSKNSHILHNFIFMAILFSSNHGCVVACLSLATARLGSLGAYQNGVLYVTYAISGLIGSTYVVKELGSRNALAFGMGLYCLYVLAFYIATNVTSVEALQFIVTMGAILGGWGAGFLWTAQGAYFTRAAQLHHSNNTNGSVSSQSMHLPLSIEDATAKLASIFAFIYLSSEIGLRALSTFALDVLKLSWSDLFAFYALTALISTILMMFVPTLPDNDVSPVGTDQTNTRSTSSVWYKATAAWRLLVQDPKMKYMIGLNAIFGFTSAFLTSYVNGTVVRYVLGSDSYVGLLTAWVSFVAAISSALFGYIASTTIRKGYVLMFGAMCFMCVAGSFILYPNVSESHQQWNWLSLVGIYTLHGIGRATFEGTLKSTFADYFAYEKEGAFANIILQNGLSSAFGFVLTFTLHCSKQRQEIWGQYCVVNDRDGTIHDVLTFEVLIVVTAFLAVFGYHRASTIRRDEISRAHYENIPTNAI